MTPVRVLHLIASSRGGGATHVRALARGLDWARFSVSVAMPKDGGHVSARDFEGAGIQFERVNISRGLDIGELSRIRRLARGADILHVHGARAALVGRLAAAMLRLAGVPIYVVYTMHGLGIPYYGRWRRLAMLAGERLLGRWTDAMIAVSRQERDAIIGLKLADPSRVSVVPNGVNVRSWEHVGGSRLATRHALGIRGDALVLTTVCRLDRPRDLETMLAAFRRVVDNGPNAQLLIVGDGPDRQCVETLVTELQLESDTLLAGMRTDIPGLLAASDAFTLTTWGWEGMPMTVLEAMAAGLPVIATKAGGIPEVVSHEETGLLVPRKDSDGLANAYTRVLSDAGLRARLGAAGRQRVIDDFTSERMVDLTSAVYERLLRPEGVHGTPTGRHPGREAGSR